MEPLFEAQFARIRDSLSWIRARSSTCRRAGPGIACVR
jgi:hypothetical protein